MTVSRGCARVAWVGLSLAVIGAAPSAHAQLNVIWNGANNDNWTSPTAWQTPLIAPTPSALFDELAIINNATTAVVTTNQTGDSNAPAGIILGQAAANSGSITINSGGSLGTAIVAGNVSLGQAVIGLAGTTASTVTVNSGGSFVPRSVMIGQNGGAVGVLQVNNGGTVNVPDTIQVGQGGRGTLNVAGGATVTAGRLNSFGNTGATASLISLGDASGLTATINVGPTTFQRNTLVTGPNVNFTATSLLLTPTSIYTADIRHATNHSALRATAGATVGGTLRPMFTGVTPTLGSYWTVVNANTISGSFTVDPSAAPALPTGQSYQTRIISGGLGQQLQVGVEQLLTLEVNRQTGALTIKNTGVGGAASVNFDAYTVGSSNGGLSGGSWNSLQDQAVAGWSELPAAATALSELQSTGTTTMAAGATRALGTPWTPQFPAFRAESDDVTFTYSTPNGNRTGVVEYVGTKVQNNLVIIVDPTTGATTLKNDSPFNVEIEGYSILSASGALRPANGQWSSLQDQGVSNFEEAAPTANALSELATSGSLAIAANSTRNMGTLFNPAGSQDLTFEFLLLGAPNSVAGVVQYASAGFAADFDSSGGVRQADLTVWRNNYPKTSGSNKAMGDADLDGDTDGHDFLIWQRQLGQGTGGTPVGAVPEPATWMLSALAGVLFVRRPRRKTDDANSTSTTTRSGGMITSNRRGGLRTFAAGLLTLTALTTAASPTRAADILFVGGDLASDLELVALLKGFGHTILNEGRFATPAGRFQDVPPTATELQGVDVVVFARSAVSTNYNNATTPVAEPAFWNTLNKPLILLNSAMLRGGDTTLGNNRWGWFNTAAASRIDPSQGDIPSGARSPENFDAFPNPSHPFVTGRTTSVFPPGQTHDWVNSNTLPTGATVVATLTVQQVIGGFPTPFTTPSIVDIPAGTTLFADTQGATSVTTARRVFFQDTEYPDTTDVFAVTTNGGQILNQIINVITSNAPSHRPGDVDGDGDVDNVDLDAIKANWNMTALNRAQGDLNGDGVTNLADFRIWKDNDPLAGAGVPEPASAGLALLGAAALLGRRRMRKQAPAGDAAGEEQAAPQGAAASRRSAVVGLAATAFALVAATAVQAANIGWVSFHAADNAPSAGAAGAGATMAVDIGYTDALTAAGHTVTRILRQDSMQNNAAVAAQLQTFDLVIVSRSVPSGDFDNDAEIAFWNGLTKPQLHLGGYVLRNVRLGYTSGGTIPDTAGPIKLQAIVPSHPVFAGIALDGTNTMVDDYTAGLPVFVGNGQTQRGISVNTDPLTGGGTLIGKVATAGDPANSGTGMIIAEWSAGAVLPNTAGGTPNLPDTTLGGKRMVLLTGGRETNGISSETAGVYDLTPTGKQIFLNAVNYLALKAGDVNGDGNVTMADYSIIRDNFQKNVASRTLGDLTLDGKVNFLDFREWKTNFVPPPGSANSVSIPEPAAGLLGLFALAALGRMRRRGHGV